MFNLEIANSFTDVYKRQEERELIEAKMAQLGTQNMAAYLRKMALDGYVVRLELPELREMAVSYTHLDVYKRQHQGAGGAAGLCAAAHRPGNERRHAGCRYPGTDGGAEPAL